MVFITLKIGLPILLKYCCRNIKSYSHSHETTCKNFITSPFPIIDISLKDTDLNKKHDAKYTETIHPIIENTHLFKEDSIKPDIKTKNMTLKTELLTKMIKH